MLFSEKENSNILLIKNVIFFRTEIIYLQIVKKKKNS